MQIFLHMCICNLKLHHADPVLPNTNITYSPQTEAALHLSFCPVPTLHRSFYTTLQYTYHLTRHPHYTYHLTLHNTKHPSCCRPPTTPIILPYPTTPMISHCATIHLLSYLHVHLHLHLHKQQHLLLSSLPAPALYLSLCPTSAHHRSSYLHFLTLTIINETASTLTCTNTSNNTYLYHFYLPVPYTHLPTLPCPTLISPHCTDHTTYPTLHLLSYIYTCTCTYFYTNPSHNMYAYHTTYPTYPYHTPIILPAPTLHPYVNPTPISLPYPALHIFSCIHVHPHLHVALHKPKPQNLLLSLHDTYSCNSTYTGGVGEL